MRISKSVKRVQRWIRRPFRSADERRHELVGPPGLWKMKRDFQIRFLESVGLQPEHRLLDLGCGTLRGGIPLIRYLNTGHYYGIEVRPEVLEEGRKELREAELQFKEPVLLLPSEIQSANLEGRFDFVWAFSVLMHLSDEILAEQLELARRCLKPDGRFYANVNCAERKDREWQGFPVVYRSWEFYESACREHGLRAENLGALSSLGHVSGRKRQDAQQMLEIRTA
jgi:SAM-dependent methyltransferase